MKKALNIYFLAILVIYMVCMGCAVTKYLPSPQVITKDSIAYRDTTIRIFVPPVFIPGDTVKLTDTVPCPEAEWKATAQSANKRTTVSAKLTHGQISIVCLTDSLLKKIDSLEAVIAYKETFKSEKIVLPPVVEHDRYIPWWVWVIVGVSVLITLLALFKR